LLPWDKSSVRATNESRAYVEAAPENSPTTGDLREFLKHKLPDYMIPSSFVVLERLPMTTTGKIDRRSLPMPEETRRVLEERFVSPGDRIEKSIATIWEEVLKSDQVGAYDNFFDLGGHSLLAGQIMSRICDEFQVELSLRTLFDNPTVGGLAEQVRDTQEKTFTLDQLAEIITGLESKSENDVQIIVEEDRD